MAWLGSDFLVSHYTPDETANANWKREHQGDIEKE